MDDAKEALYELLMYSCAWCAGPLDDNSAIFYGSPGTPGADYSSVEGCFMPFPVKRKYICMFVVPKDSDAYRDNWRLSFAVCCEECQEKIRAGIDEARLELAIEEAKQGQA